MELLALHHVGMCVRDGDATKMMLEEKVGFQVVGLREKPYRQWYLRQGEAVIIVTEHPSSRDKITFDHFAVLCSQDQEHHCDAVFNVAIVVKNVSKLTDKIQSIGGQIVSPVSEVRDTNGVIEYSVVSPNIGHIVHTLLDLSKYSGSLLPGFLPFGCKNDEALERCFGITHFDHVTFACPAGKSTKILQFYEKWIGAKRLYINRNEDYEEGLVIKDIVGMRLKAMEYWKCAESGVEVIYKRKGQQKLVFVIAEPLDDIVQNHVSAFLKALDGSSVEHIALYTTKMARSISTARKAGLEFRDPPPSYYEQDEIRRNIIQVGEDIQKLKKRGILLDKEERNVDICESKNPYLMQIFTKPLFGPNTFFFEFIQRQGAVGFGAGNVTALARSIEMEKQRQA